MTDVAELLEFLSDDERADLKRNAARLAKLRGPEADVAYQRDPIRWAGDVLGVVENTIRWSLFPEYQFHTWDGTPDPLALIAEALAAGDDVGVESAIGTGKTFEAGWLALWFFACFADSIVVTTAPKKDSLTKLLWKEIGRHWPKFKKRYPHAEKIELTARMRPGADEQEVWAIVGQTAGVEAGTQSATKAQGHHAEHMLVITEETPGIPSQRMEALRNTLVAEHNIQLSLGNPDSQFDELHQFCMRPGVRHIIVSSLDHPNVVLNRAVIPGATSRKGIANIAAKHAPGTPMYDSRVRGRSPEQPAEALIQLAWLKDAVARAKARGAATGLGALGIDPSNSERGDPAAIAHFIGRRIMSVRTKPCPDSNQLGRDVYAEYLQPETAAVQGRVPIRPEHVGVDNIGVGAGTLNELRHLAGHMVQACNGSAAVVKSAQRAPDGSAYSWLDDTNEFRNLRAQMYWQLREDARLGVLEIDEEDLELFVELTSITWEPRGGVTVVQAKEDVKKKLRRSPNRADAVVYGNWVRAREPLVVAPEAAIDAGRDPEAVLDEQRERDRSRWQPRGEVAERDPSSEGTASSMFGDDW